MLRHATRLGRIFSFLLLAFWAQAQDGKSVAVWQKAAPELKARTKEEVGSKEIRPIPGMQCVLFDPNTLTKKEMKDGPKPFGTLHWLYTNMKSQDDGYVLKIIKHYGMNASCTINDSFNPFHFMLVDGHAPTGKMTGELCFHYHLSSLRLVYYGPGPIRWYSYGKDMRGYHIEWGGVKHGALMHSFIDKEAALSAIEAIKAFSLTYDCYYQRPYASFTYMKSD
ncbi:MAG: hypothetical protein JWO13_1523 [Acidobacteriales bacterium]|nr:hypothetical protein [Terriglobales bacterium]